MAPVRHHFEVGSLHSAHCAQALIEKREELVLSGGAAVLSRSRIGGRHSRRIGASSFKNRHVYKIRLDPVTVRDVLRHADLKTTERYLHAVRGSGSPTLRLAPSRPSSRLTPRMRRERRFARRSLSSRRTKRADSSTAPDSSRGAATRVGPVSARAPYVLVYRQQAPRRRWHAPGAGTEGYFHAVSPMSMVMGVSGPGWGR